MSNNNLQELLNYSQSLKVLFVEDNYDVRIQLEKLLKNFFTNIDVEIDGQKAYEKYLNYKKNTSNFYDLIITDLSMPRLDGIDLCKNILKENPNQLILVISAHTESDKLTNLINIGVNKFLQKPVDYKELLSTLTSIIEEIKKYK